MRLRRTRPLLPPPTFGIGQSGLGARSDSSHFAELLRHLSASRHLGFLCCNQLAAALRLHLCQPRLCRRCDGGQAAAFCLARGAIVLAST